MDATELERLIQTAMQGQSAASGAANQTAQSLNQLTRTTASQTSASQMASQASASFASSQQRADSASKQFGTTVTEAARSATGLMQSMYGAEKAFTGFTPALDTYSAMLQSTIKILGESLNGVGFTVGGLGINIGKLSSLISEGAIKGLTLLTDGLKIALDSSQRVADSFVAVAKVGATFSTSISEFAITARDLGIPLQQFSKIVTSNVENIGRLGLGMKNGAIRLGEFTSALYDSDPVIRAQYGSMEAIAQATGTYMALQTQLGVVAQKNSKEQIEGAREYLLRQKELSNITGKTAERLAQEEEARRRELAYASKLGRLTSADAKNNVEEGMQLAGKIFGERGASYAKEFFATGGKVISKESLEFAAMMPDAADTIGQFMTTVDKGRKEYQQGNAAYLRENASAIEAQARSGEDLAELTYATANPQLKAMSDVNGSILNNLSTIKNYTDIIKGIEEERAKIGKLRAPREGEMPGVQRRDVQLDEATEAFVTASKTLRDTQLTLDKFVLEQMMPKMGAVAEGLGTLAVNQIRAIDATIEGIKKMSDIASGVKKDLADLVDQIKERTIGMAIPAIERMRENLPARAAGGLATGPTIAGENGTEAVIPLAGGAVPMNIDWTPLVTILRENTDLNREMLDALEDSVDVQQRILQASY